MALLGACERSVDWPTEAYAFLVGAPVFKTGEADHLGLAGSIPVRLRHKFCHNAGKFPALQGGRYGA